MIVCLSFFCGEMYLIVCVCMYGTLCQVVTDDDGSTFVEGVYSLGSAVWTPNMWRVCYRQGNSTEFSAVAGSVKLSFVVARV